MAEETRTPLAALAYDSDEGMKARANALIEQTRNEPCTLSSIKERVAKDALYAAVRNYDADAIDAALTAAAQLQLQSSHAYQMAKAEAPSIRLWQQDRLKQVRTSIDLDVHEQEKHHKQSSKKCTLDLCPDGFCTCDDFQTRAFVHQHVYGIRMEGCRCYGGGTCDRCMPKWR